jgi:hypothetical protein
MNIEYRGRKVFRDTANLGYTLRDVADCLAKLTSRDYKKTHYRENTLPDDEYICSYVREDEGEQKTDRLYIKFCIIDGYLLIDLASFHLS